MLTTTNLVFGCEMHSGISAMNHMTTRVDRCSQDRSVTRDRRSDPPGAFCVSQVTLVSRAKGQTVAKGLRDLTVKQLFRSETLYNTGS